MRAFMMAIAVTGAAGSASATEAELPDNRANGVAADVAVNQLALGDDTGQEVTQAGGDQLAATPDPAGSTPSDPETGHGLPDYLNTAIQYGYTWSASNDFILGYGSDSKDRHQIRFEHQQTFKYGNAYFFFDRVSAPSNLGGERDFGFPCCGDGKNAEVYTVFNGDLSLSRVLDKPVKLGPFKDVSLSVRGEYGSFFDFKAVGLGLSADVDVPGFDEPGDYVRINWWRRWADDDFVSGAFDAGGAASTRYADHNLWGLTVRKTFDLGGVRMSHQTFLRYQQASRGNAKELRRYNRVFWESELFAYLTDRLSVGFRSEYFRDAGGISFGGRKSDWRPVLAVKVDLFNR